MAKLTREQKIELFKKRKEGYIVSSLSKAYGITERKIYYLISLIDRHRTNILRRDKNRQFSKTQKEEIINHVLIYNQPIVVTSIEYGLLSDGILHSWIKSYKENGVIIEKKRGRIPIMKIQLKQQKKRSNILKKSVFRSEK